MYRLIFFLCSFVNIKIQKLSFDYTDIKTDDKFSAMSLLYDDLTIIQKKLLNYDNSKKSNKISSSIFEKYVEKNILTTPSNGGINYQKTTTWYDIFLFHVINFLVKEKVIDNPLFILRKISQQDLIHYFSNKFDIQVIQYGSNINYFIIITNSLCG